MAIEQCLICERPGDVIIKEKLPDGEAWMQCQHDTIVHDWLQTYGSSSNRNTQHVRMHCPQCGEMGKIQPFRYDGKKPWLVTYLINHGRVGKRGKLVRHYIRDPEQRKTILKRLGFT